jgi:hypothetical protein
MAKLYRSNLLQAMFTGRFGSIHKDERRGSREEYAAKAPTFANAVTKMADKLAVLVAKSLVTANKYDSSDILTRGKSMKTFVLSIVALIAGTVPASAITVTAPVDGAQVTSPFTVTASTTSCESHTAVSMGYSIDNGPSTIVHKTQLSAVVIAGDGPHVLHVKCWGPNGAHDHTPVNITVVPANTTPPNNITVVSNIQSLPNWVWDHDPGTNGDSSGTSDLISSPSLSGNTRQFSVNFSDSGGEIFHSSFGKDTAATHFIYDAYLWLSDASSLANIEMDMNQVIANGDTVIYGFQCNGYAGTWDYALNPGQPAGRWHHSNVACPDPKTWAPNTWHHVQISYSRVGGIVTYETVALDGQQSDLVGATGNSASPLGWGQTLLTNFQLDGHGSDGSITAYVDNLTISRW